MKQLIPIGRGTFGGDGDIPMVNGRDLYAFLGIGKDYSSWIKAQIARCKFVENRDYIIFAQKGVNSLSGETRGRKGVEYGFTLDAAKHIGMLAGTQKGHEVREYFLECEKVAHSRVMLPDFTDPSIAARAWADERDRAFQLDIEKKQLEYKAAEDEPKVTYPPPWVDMKSRMSREAHVRNCESLGVRFPWATRLSYVRAIVFHPYPKERLESRINAEDGQKWSNSHG